MTTPKKKKKWILPAILVTTVAGLASWVIFSDSARQTVVSAGLNLMNKSIDYHISTLHPAVRERFRALVKAWQAAGWDVTINSSYRNLAKQALVKRGSAVAAKSISWHSFGMAIDVNLVKGKTVLRMASSKQQWLDSGIVAIAKKLGFRWGGDFEATGYDPVHFDTGADYNRDKLYAAGVKQFGNDPNNFRGNELKIAA